MTDGRTTTYRNGSVASTRCSCCLCLRHCGCGCDWWFSTQPLPKFKGFDKSCFLNMVFYMEYHFLTENCVDEASTRNKEGTQFLKVPQPTLGCSGCALAAEKFWRRHCRINRVSGPNSLYTSSADASPPYRRQAFSSSKFKKQGFLKNLTRHLAAPGEAPRGYPLSTGGGPGKRLGPLPKFF